MTNIRMYLRAAGVALLLGVSHTASAAGACDGLLPDLESPAPRGPVTAEILARLRDAGQFYHYQPDRPILSQSPDKQSVAFEIHRADPATDSYCTGIVVVPLVGGAKPYLVDTGNEIIMDARPARGWAAYESGIPLALTPRWSPGGQWLAFLKRVNGSTQVWRADLADRKARQVMHAQADVEDFRIAADGHTIVYTTRPGLAENNAAIDREGRTGWRFDDRSLPIRGSRPQTPNAETRYTSLDVQTGSERSASAAEAELLGSPTRLPKEASAYAVGPDGRLAWNQPADTSVYPPDYDLVVETAPGQRAQCKASICKTDQLSRIWWSDDGKRIRFTHSEGWADSETAIYEWLPGQGTARRLLVTSDRLVDCQPRGNDLLCFRDRATDPRHLVLLGLDSKKEQRFFDANPEFASLTMGRVERRNWRNGLGHPFYGDLVYPTDYTPGRRYPMVIVQYRTKGFLRGGVGDEMPIHAFANRGYFVLVLDIGDAAAMAGPRKSYYEQQVAIYRDLLGPRHALSAAETLTRTLIDKGLVDPKGVGIYGLSAGSRIAQYAAINSTVISAGSLGTCCHEPTEDSLAGPLIAGNNHAFGFPRMIDRVPEFWSQISIMNQPERVKFPILMQLADREQMVAMASYTALSQAQVPVDMFVFPDEYHNKWHPAHRLAVYERNLAWFDFWLKDQLPDEPRARAEAMRWREMREKWRQAKEAPRKQ